MGVRLCAGAPRPDDGCLFGPMTTACGGAVGAYVQVPTFGEAATVAVKVSADFL